MLLVAILRVGSTVESSVRLHEELSLSFPSLVPSVAFCPLLRVEVLCVSLPKCLPLSLSLKYSKSVGHIDTGARIFE